MAGRRTARCAFCGQAFTVERRSGPAPRYCSQAHRQRAYEERRRTSRTEEESSLAEELRALRGRISWLEHENRELRRERDDAYAEMVRLRQQHEPQSPVLQRLTDPAPAAQDPAVEAPAPPKRRWSLPR